MTDMATPPRFAARTRMGALFAGVFLLTGTQAPFLPVWLGLKGFSVEEIGWLLAAPRAMQVISLPLAARTADRGGRIIRQLTIAAALATAIYAALPFFQRGGALVALLLCLFLALSAAMPLLDVFVYSLPPENGVRVDFGSVRKWGSLAFVTGSLMGGAVLGYAGALALPSLLALCGLTALGCCAFAAPLDESRRAQAAADSGGPAAIGLPLVATIAVEALVQGSHTQLGTLGSVHWAEQGHGSLFIGSAAAISVIAETFAFGGFGRWFGPGSGRRLLVIGALAAAARWTVMAFDPPGYVILPLQALHALSFAGTHFGAMELVARLAPRANRGFMQGSMIAATSGLNACLAAASGAMQVHWGQAGAYAAMVALAVAGLALVPVIGRESLTVSPRESLKADSSPL